MPLISKRFANKAALSGSLDFLPYLLQQTLPLKPIHYGAIAAAIGLIALLYFAGNTVAPKKEDKMAAAMAQGGTPGERQAAGLDIPKPADFDSLLTASKKRLSPPHRPRSTALKTALPGAT